MEEKKGVLTKRQIIYVFTVYFMLTFGLGIPLESLKQGGFVVGLGVGSICCLILGWIFAFRKTVGE